MRIRRGQGSRTDVLSHARTYDPWPPEPESRAAICSMPVCRNGPPDLVEPSQAISIHSRSTTPPPTCGCIPRAIGRQRGACLALLLHQAGDSIYLGATDGHLTTRATLLWVKLRCIVGVHA